MSIALVDYGVGNLRSVQKALERVGAGAVVTRDPETIMASEAMVLPGVGAFAECMGNLEKYGLTETVKAYARLGRPFLGICVGYQILFEGSDEFGSSAGLGVFRGRCVQFPKSSLDHHKIPHMGWNQVEYQKADPLFDGVRNGTDFYFVHSYFPVPAEEVTLADTEYGVRFAAASGRGRLYGVQFHPEKSQAAGLKVLENFARMARG